MQTPIPSFADVYDAVVGDDFKDRWWKGFQRYVRGHRLRFASVCDVACGTGVTALRLAERGGIRVTGVDLSEDMLRVARARCADLPHGHRVTFLRQPMQELTLPEPVDLIVCAYDSLNALASVEELTATLRRFALHLNPGGHVVCDMLTRRHLAEEWGNGEFRAPAGELDSIWHTTWEPRRGRLSVHVTVHVDGAGGGAPHRVVHRVVHQVEEYAYPQTVVEQAIREAGLEVVEVRDLIPWAPAAPPHGENADRWFYLLRRPGSRPGATP